MYKGNNYVIHYYLFQTMKRSHTSKLFAETKNMLYEKGVCAQIRKDLPYPKCYT